MFTFSVFFFLFFCCFMHSGYKYCVLFKNHLCAGPLTVCVTSFFANTLTHTHTHTTNNASQSLLWNGTTSSCCSWLFLTLISLQLLCNNYTPHYYKRARGYESPSSSPEPKNNLQHTKCNSNRHRKLGKKGNWKIYSRQISWVLSVCIFLSLTL